LQLRLGTSEAKPVTADQAPLKVGVVPDGSQFVVFGQRRKTV
jgi:hypothetical protein